MNGLDHVLVMLTSEMMFWICHASHLQLVFPSLGQRSKSATYHSHILHHCIIVCLYIC